MLNKTIRILAVAVAAILAATLAAPVAASGTVSSTSSDSGASNNSVTVSYTVTNTGDSATAYILDLSLPDGWGVTDHSDAGSEWKGDEYKWLWTEIGPAETKTTSITISPAESASGSGVVTGVLKTSDGTVSSTSQAIGDSLTVQDVLDRLNSIEPATTTKVQVTDSSEAGATVEPASTNVVESVTFAEADVAGSVTITEYTDLPEELRKQASQSITTAVATQSSPDTDSEASVDIVSMTDISPATEQAEEAAATVTLSVSRAEVETPKQLTVVHESTLPNKQKTWERLETTVKNSTGDEITVVAQTDGFSMFAVAEVKRNQGGRQNTTVLVVVAAVLAGMAIIYLRRRQDGT